MFRAVIGLEVHLQLRTRTKMFSRCRADYFGEEPNTFTDPLTLGLPGTLPTINRQAVELALMFGLALDCEVEGFTQFHRKNYFYPDAPKNFQISQYDRPIARDGFLMVSGKRIGIRRAHLEDDAGKLIHPTYADHSLLDLNRAGMPLIEMVTEPDIETPEQARDFLHHVRAIAQALGVSDANPEEGKMRCDVNVSLHRPGEPWGTKVEVKNLNSFRSVQRSLEYEIARQTRVLEGRRARHAGHHGLGRGRAAHLRDAHERRGERLPLLSRAGPAAARHHPPSGPRGFAPRCPNCPPRRSAVSSRSVCGTPTPRASRTTWNSPAFSTRR
jgi:aspartyl-tRNA(Asn)/glutamyl-tRNA(Gln) amidotransferase subunit B